MTFASSSFCGEEENVMVQSRWAERCERPRRVLVVEDNEDVAQGLMRILKLRGHDVVVAYDGPAAVEVALSRQFDVVLCDLGLPKLDGFDVVRALRENPATADLSIAALTAFGLENKARALRSGFDQYLLKPVRLGEMLSFVEGHPFLGSG
jgi:CheY-like chemotaxis protein